MNMFREYDIRGVVDEDLTEEMIEKIGKAVGTHMHGNVIVGRDNRTHGQRVRDIFVNALLSTGCDVIDIGIVTSPILYFASKNYPNAGAVMITASHNPKEYNGFKMIRKGKPVYGEEIQEIRKLAESRKFKEGEGAVVDKSPIEDYENLITKMIKLNKKLRVVIDCGNGSTGFTTPKILEDLGCEVVGLYCEPDGNFPNHEPDPVVEKNLIDLIAKVKELKADLGIAFDGDGDRLGVVDENGEIIPGDKLLIILARDLLSRSKGEKIIYEVKCSMTLGEDIKKNRGVPVMYKVGHSLIKAKMKREDASLAGEMSGHFFFKELGFFDDALYAACRIMEIMVHSGKKISELLEGVPETFVTPEIRDDCPDNLKKEVIRELQKRFKKYKPLTIDGVRINFGDGWGLVRASNTGPKLILRFEAKSPEKLAEIKSLIEKEVQDVKSNALAKKR